MASTDDKHPGYTSVPADSIKDLKLTYADVSKSGVRPPIRNIETFQYAYAEDALHADAWVTIIDPEYNAICPKTGLPDFGTLTIRYRPDTKIVELKALREYMHNYRNIGIFYEHAANLIFRDLWFSLEPYALDVTLKTNPRGGISSEVRVVKEREDTI